MAQKTRIIIYIAIAVTVLALGIIAVISAPKDSAPQTADEFLNAGNKYLIELSYDKAVIEFNKAIEIEPRNADAYIGLAEAYLGMGDEDKAVETLELGYEKTGDDRVKAKLDELIGEDNVTTTSAYTPNATETTTESIPETFIDKMVEFYIPCSEEWNGTGWRDYSSYYGSTSTETDKYIIDFFSSDYYGYFYVNYKLKDEKIGDESPLTGWIETPVLEIRFDDKDGFEINTFGHHHIDYPCNVAYPAITYYDESGNLVQRAENEYNQELQLIKSVVYDASDTVKYEITYEYDDEGRLIKSGNEKEFVYDENGNLIKEIIYNDGEHSYFFEWKYNKDNKPLSQNCSGALWDDIEWTYDSNGNLISVNVDNDYEITTYDSNGNLLTHNIDYYDDAYSNNTFEYNSAGQCVKVSAEDRYSSGDYIVYRTWTYTYGSDGQVNSCDFYHKDSELPYEGGMLDEFQYDSNGRVSRMKRTHSSGSIDEATYEYDSEGRMLKSETQNSYGTNETVQYTYGDHGKLTEILCKDDYSSETYSYKYMKIALPSIFVEQIKNEYGIDLAA